MKESLVRFGVAMEASLLEELDALVEARGASRSELLRDMVRAEVIRSRVASGASAVAALTIVYDHHVRDLTERLTEFQHSLGDKVNSSLHVHLDHDYCLEVIVMKGPADELKRAADKLLATRGVKHGGVELIAITPPIRRVERSHHDHAHAHDHPHDHGHDHAHGPPPRRAKKAAPARRRARKA